ncbi:hypothetical protein M0R45_003716 [Rubus argutus]|uniref:Beta-galactosidase galactose-binding domain-containing protein n=1 Tax=Rubus argutus TaxID=59490 RepID=A0AAW1YG81_RUBAR
MEYTLTHGNITTKELGNSVSTTYSSLIAKKEGYNTAKKVKKSVNKAEDEPESLHWTWRPESIDDTKILGKGEVVANHLLEQKEAANDDSDYLWYMTSVQLSKDDPILSGNMTLRINETGYILHAFVNGELTGSQWATYNVFNYVFEKPIKLNPGKNTISLLSATVDFRFNYGGGYENINTGIIGPVSIGWTKQLQSSLGTEPVVVDLLGLGKGHAWVNGHSIGRYWPSYLAKEDGCSVDACDYRGTYDNNKCVSNCGKPTQRWYHVPRSFERR